MKTVVAVLAAGLSRRRPKQLLDFRGVPLIRHAALTALGAGCDETIVIGSVSGGAGGPAGDDARQSGRGGRDELSRSAWLCGTPMARGFCSCFAINR